MLFWLATAFVVLLWLAWAAQPWLFTQLGIVWNAETLGPWGDTFRALNALFAALGFLIIVTTLRMQQSQIRQAREDQKQLNQEAREEQHRHRFEGSFFQLLRLLRESGKAVRFRHSSEYVRDTNAKGRPVVTGYRAFRAAWEEAKLRLDTAPAPSREDAADIYDQFVHTRYERYFGPYFHLLYTMLRRIKDDPVLSPEEKVEYGNLLRSQLTGFEIALAGLNGCRRFQMTFLLWLKPSGLHPVPKTPS